MTLASLADLPLALQLHLWPALAALGLGPIALYRRRRDIWHKAAGYAWVCAMALVAGAAFWLEATILPIAFGFGAIHALSAFVLFGLWRGVAATRAGDRAGHASWMRALYWQALIVAGTLTLLPGRTLNVTLFPDHPIAGVVLIVAIGAVMLLRGLRGIRAGRARRAAG